MQMVKHIIKLIYKFFDKNKDSMRIFQGIIFIYKDN